MYILIVAMFIFFYLGFLACSILTNGLVADLRSKIAEQKAVIDESKFDMEA